MHILRAVFFSFVLMFAASAHADSASYEQVKGKALRAVFADTMMLGEYRQFREINETFHYTEFHFKNGTSDYLEGETLDKGLWWLVGADKICYKYPKSDQYTRTYCFVVYLSEGCYYKYSVYNMTLKGPRDWDNWSSRAVRKGTGKSCAEAIG